MRKFNVFLQFIPAIIVIIGVLYACSERTLDVDRMLLDHAAYPYVTRADDTYYFTMQTNKPDTISLFCAHSIEAIPSGDRREIVVNPMQDIYSPEIHHIGNNWYIYFEGDDGNTDNHQLYVLENSGDPMTDDWTLHGPIITNEECNFGIHPTTLVVDGHQYLFWSGWQKQRSETETQCIFMAEMSDPWTTASERVLLSSPQLEWERQWINPDGTRAAYPIFVNENPEAFLSPDGSKVIVNYSASGIWTVYSTLGTLIADADSDLLDPNNWTKSQQPVDLCVNDSTRFGASNISIVSLPDETFEILYESKRYDENGGIIKQVYHRPLAWVDNLPQY